MIATSGYYYGETTCGNTAGQGRCPCCGQTVYSDSSYDTAGNWNNGSYRVPAKPNKKKPNYKAIFREWLRHLYQFKFKEVLMLKSTSILHKTYFRKVLFSNSGHISNRLRGRFKNR